MSIAITDDHRALAGTASDFLTKHGARAAARDLLEAPEEGLPKFWDELRAVGWLGLHVPEEHGGSGYGLPELVVVVEEMGRAVAPGPFVPTVMASAVLAAAAPAEVQARYLPGLAAGTAIGAVALGGDVEVRDGRAHGPAGVVLGGALADVLLVPVGDDVALIDTGAGGVAVDSPTNLDPTRRAARVTLDGAAATVIPGARRTLVDLSRLILAAEATGVARETTDQAADYAKVREQFGRPIAMYQAVKHHCANMLVAVELATAAVWDAARAASTGGDQLSYTAAMAATLALPAADQNAQLNIQVHGGIGFTWEHDAHLYLRRASALGAILDVGQAAADVTDLTRQGVRRERSVDLPPEAEPIRDEVRAFAAEIKDLDADAQRARLIESGYVMPHWPRPYGRDAGAVEQLVIEQEFKAAGVEPAGLRHHRLGHPHADPARQPRPGGAVGAPGAQPGSHLVPAVQRARRRLGRRRHQDPWHPHRRRLAGERPEGVDLGGARGRDGLRHRAHRPRRPQAQRHHHHGHRHARRGRRGAAAQDGDGQLGVQRGVLRQRLRARRRRGRPGRRRLDGGPGHAGERERQHRRRPGRHGAVRRRPHRPVRRPPRAPGGRGGPGRALRGADPGDGRAQPAQRPPGGGRGRRRDPRATSPSWSCPRTATRPRPSWPS